MAVYKVKNTYNLADFYHAIAQKHPMQLSNQFIVQFTVPNGQTGSGSEVFGVGDYTDPSAFTYWCQSASIPQADISDYTVNFLANDFKCPGMVQYNGTWQTQVMIDQDFTQYKRLQRWQKYLTDLSKSAGGRKIIPNVTAKVSMLDNTMQKIQRAFVLEGIFPNQLGAMQHQYQAGGTAVATCSVGWNYQYYYPAKDLENPTDSDPLSMMSVMKVIGTSVG